MISCVQNDNEHYNELFCIKGTFDDEIVYYLDKADQDKSDFDDLSANNSLDNINHSSSSTSSNDNIDKSDDDSDKDYYSDNLLISEDNEKDLGNLLVSGDIDNDDSLIINGDTCDDHNQSNEDEPLLDNSDMDFLGKSGSAKDNIEFLPDLFNGVRHLQCECERNLLNSDDIDKDQCSDNFLGSDNESVNIVTSISNYYSDNLPYEGNFLGSDDSTLVQAVVPMKGLDVCLMEEDNLASFVDEQLCNLRDFIVNGWPNSKTDVPVSKLCHWFLQDELGYYSGVLMKGS